MKASITLLSFLILLFVSNCQPPNPIFQRLPIVALNETNQGNKNINLDVKDTL
jgi:hypothetical protein